MKNYVFYTSDGFTKDNQENEVDNCQILGWNKGADEKEAFINFKKENIKINFKNICCQELVSSKVFYL